MPDINKGDGTIKDALGSLGDLDDIDGNGIEDAKGEARNVPKTRTNNLVARTSEDPQPSANSRDAMEADRVGFNGHASQEPSNNGKPDPTKGKRYSYASLSGDY